MKNIKLVVILCLVGTFIYRYPDYWPKRLKGSHFYIIDEWNSWHLGYSEDDGKTGYAPVLDRDTCTIFNFPEVYWNDTCVCMKVDNEEGLHFYFVKEIIREYTSTCSEGDSLQHKQWYDYDIGGPFSETDLNNHLQKNGISLSTLRHKILSQ